MLNAARLIAWNVSRDGFELKAIKRMRRSRDKSNQESAPLQRTMQFLFVSYETLIVCGYSKYDNVHYFVIRKLVYEHRHLRQVNI
jgi:hypothetical protein